MHDCPSCRVPLHGYETECPACGAPQRVTKTQSKLFGSDLKKPSTNYTPFIIIFVVMIGLVAVMAQTSWIGQLITRGPVKEDPLAKMTFQEARTLIDTKLNEGITAAGCKGTLKWQRDDKEVDKLSAGPINLTVDADLPTPEQHKAIVDPVKDYMDKAQITSLVFNDTKDPKTHRNWTYTVAPAPADGAAPAAGGAAPAQ
jgi:hypothetical protein